MWKKQWHIVNEWIASKKYILYIKKLAICLQFHWSLRWLMFIVSFMETQTTLLLEALTTGFTRKGFEVWMASHVICQTLLTGKCTTTYVTGIWLLSSVNTFMLLQVVFSWETLVTILAHKRTVTGVSLQKIYTIHIYHLGKIVTIQISITINPKFNTIKFFHIRVTITQLQSPHNNYEKLCNILTRGNFVYPCIWIYLYMPCREIMCS